MKKQQGFTLIELMIAVAIVGILAAVAIPQFQGYIARSQVSEAVTLLGALQAPVNEYFHVNGELPKIASLGSVRKSGKYVSTIKDIGTPGTFQATFARGNTNSEIGNKTLVIQFFSLSSPKCITDGTNKSTLPSALLPSICN